MRFRAYIHYNLMQSREAKKFNDKEILGTTIVFTFQDILLNPDFIARELIIPWLQAGNIPEII